MAKRSSLSKDMGPYALDFWERNRDKEWTEGKASELEEAIRKDKAILSGQTTYTTSSGETKSLLEPEQTESGGGSGLFSKLGSAISAPFTIPKYVIGNVAEWAFTQPGMLEDFARSGGGQGSVQGLDPADDESNAKKRALVLQQPVTLGSGKTVTPVPEGQSLWGAIKQGLTREDPVHLGTAFSRGMRGANLSDEELASKIRSGEFANEKSAMGSNMAAALGLLGDPWTYATFGAGGLFKGAKGGQTAMQARKAGSSVKDAAAVGAKNVIVNYPKTGRATALTDTAFLGGEGDPNAFLMNYGLAGVAGKAVPAGAKFLKPYAEDVKEAAKVRLPGPSTPFPASATERGIDPSLLARQSELQAAIKSGQTLDEIMAMPKQTVVPGKGVVRNELPYDAALIKTALNSSDEATRIAAKRFMLGRTSSPMRLAYDPKLTGTLQTEREAAMSKFLREGVFSGKQGLAKAAQEPASVRGAGGKFQKNFLRSDAEMLLESLQSSDPDVRSAARQLLRELRSGYYGN